jgi:hypothetical protein
MKAIGKLYEVTNIERFIATYLANPNKPDKTTFKPISAARVHIGATFPFFGFYPFSSVKTETDSTGKFELDCSLLPHEPPAYLIAYRQLQTVNVFGMTIPIFGPIYRSQSFQTSQIDNNSRAIYVIKKELPDDQGISQTQIAAQVDEAKSKINNLDSLSASIGDKGINIVAKGRGATITFRVSLSPSTSNYLDMFITGKIEDFDVDLPGPDFITSLCVSKDNIEKAVSKGISSIMVAFNQQIKQSIINTIAQSSGLNSALVQGLFDTSLSLTFDKVRYPVVETKKIAWMTLKIRTVVADPCLGFPKKLYG